MFNAVRKNDLGFHPEPGPGDEMAQYLRSENYYQKRVHGTSTNGSAAASYVYIYDVIKITLLLCTLIFAISYIQKLFRRSRKQENHGEVPRDRGQYHGSLVTGDSHPLLFLLIHPLFIGFTSAGLPLGVTFPFLISSPMVDLGSLILLMSIFGPKVAVVYVSLGLIVAIIGGTIIESSTWSHITEEFIHNTAPVWTSIPPP